MDPTTSVEYRGTSINGHSWTEQLRGVRGSCIGVSIVLYIELQRVPIKEGFTQTAECIHTSST